jgi:hypothetical protein
MGRFVAKPGTRRHEWRTRGTAGLQTLASKLGKD